MKQQRNHLMVEGIVALALTVAMGAGCSSKKKVADENIDNTSRAVASVPPDRGLQDAPIPEKDVPTAYFEFDSAALSSDAIAVASEQSQFLKDNTDHTVVIIGGADERGTEAYNYRLGLRRAASVRKELIRQGVPASRIQIRSVGESQPVANGHDEDSWAQNRRAEVHVNPPDRMAMK